jgi:hypothetical protein
MSTTLVDSWAVDISTLGPVYPFVGAEVLMVILALAFWIIWHIWQLRHESRTYNEERAKLATKEALEKAMNEGRLD